MAFIAGVLESILRRCHEIRRKLGIGIELALWNLLEGTEGVLWVGEFALRAEISGDAATPGYVSGIVVLRLSKTAPIEIADRRGSIP